LDDGPNVPPEKCTVMDTCVENNVLEELLKLLKLEQI
jgi:hypothetical protein